MEVGLGADKVSAHLDRPRWVERSFYRHHRLVGGLLFIGAIFVLYVFLFSYNTRHIATAVAPGQWRLMDAFTGGLVVGSVLAALVGIIVLVKPSLLREIEKSTNRWTSTDGMMKFFNAMRYSSDQHVLRYGNIVGLSMIAGGLYILTVMGTLLWQ